MPLYHFSEEPGIEVFEPRVVSASAIPCVWAIDEWHAPMYYVPRDCPRACFWAGDATTQADAERWLGGSHARMVITIESGWLERVRTTTLYRYTMPANTFKLHDATAGHWISRDVVVPERIDRLDDLLQSLVDAGVELRITPYLLDFWDRVITSTLAFSGTRLRNARRSDCDGRAPDGRLESQTSRLPRYSEHEPPGR